VSELGRAHRGEPVSRSGEAVAVVVTAGRYITGQTTVIDGGVSRVIW
jgi:hypothetical protein